LQAREEQKDQQCQRQGLRHEAGGEGKGGARILQRGGRALRGDHAGHQGKRGERHVAGGHQALPVEEMRYQEKTADEQEAEAVAWRVRLQQLGAGKKGQQRHPASRADYRAVAEQHPRHPGQGQQHLQNPPHPMPPGLLGNQAQQGKGEPGQADPERQMQRMRRQYQQQGDEQPEEGEKGGGRRSGPRPRFFAWV